MVDLIRNKPADLLRDKLRRNEMLYRAVWTGRHLRASAAAGVDFYADWRRYTHWWHGLGRDRTLAQHERALLKAYHGIEKGLSLADCRPGFGQMRIRDVMRQIENWPDLPEDNEVVLGAVSTLYAYVEFNAGHGLRFDWLDHWLSSYPPSAGRGGTRETSRLEILDAVAAGGEQFFRSRSSIRQFGSDPVPMDQIRLAVSMAQKSPSVCNRQGPRAYCFEDPMEALRWQPGNRGFGHLASRALVVTVDLQAFSGPGERNQAWVDGGMFAMSLLYALHSLGYGACPLAWSQRSSFDRQARAALGIPPNEVIIMMIAVGTLPERFRVAVSQRLSGKTALIERSAPSLQSREARTHDDIEQTQNRG